MAVISDIIIGAVTYKVYGLTADAVQDADDYLAARIGSTWSTATTLQKQQALVSAARYLDRIVEWTGVQTDLVTPQPREWPRDGASCDGVAVTDGTIPDDIALAEFEMANILFGDATAQDATGTGSNVKRVKAGSAEVEFFSSTLGSEFETRMPAPVNDLAGCYVKSTGTFGGSFGTTTDDADPGYCKDDYDRSEGYP